MEQARFGHELWSEVAQALLSPAESARLHLLALELGGRAVEKLGHVQKALLGAQSREQVDALRVRELDLVERAAGECRAGYDYPRAIELYRDLASRLVSEPARRSKALGSAADLCLSLNRLDEAEDFARQGASAASRAQLVSEECEHLVRHADALRRRGNFDAALDKIERAHDAAEAAGFELGIVRGIALRGSLYASLGDYDASLPLLAQADEGYAKLGEHKQRVNVLINQAIARDAMGDHREGERLFKAAGDVAGAMNDRANVGKGLVGQAWAIHFMGRFDEALSLLARAEEIYQQVGDVIGQAEAIDIRGTILLRKGELRAALKCLSQAEAVHRDAGNMPSVASCVGARGELLRESGELEAALETFALAADIYRSLNMQRAEAGELARMASTLSMLGRFDEALDRAGEAEAIGRELGDQRVVAGNKLFLAEELLRRGEHERALSVAAETEALGRAHNGILEAAGALRVRGEVQRQRGDATAAVRSFDESAAMAAGAGDAGTHALALCRKGQAQLTVSPMQARDTLKTALEVLKGAVEDRSVLRFEALCALAQAEAALGENPVATAKRAREAAQNLRTEAWPHLKTQLEAMQRLATGQ